MTWIVSVIVVVCFLSINILTGALADRKGYSFLTWFFAGGVFGLLVLAFLPFANATELSETERDDSAKKGNLYGRIIAYSTFALVALQLMR